jgi:hypothetical protein
MTVPAIRRATAPLEEIDAAIDASPRGRLTLAPNRTQATPLVELVGALAEPNERPHLTALASGVAEAQLRCFPENLLWDFDFYVASVHRRARQARSYADYLEHVAEITVGLMGLYGQQSTIRFRYVHDFIYGFDWARWVRRDPATRRAVGPFSIEFLQQIETRGRDILTLIESDDALYPQLSGPGARNPFAFSREPDDELRLYRALAERGCIPVEAWRADAQPNASLDFDALREETAGSLGLSR